MRSIFGGKMSLTAPSDAAMATKVSLANLADMAIGTPETGNVNFNALHTLLKGIIKHLGITDVATLYERWPPASPSSQTVTYPPGSKSLSPVPTGHVAASGSTPTTSVTATSAPARSATPTAGLTSSSTSSPTPSNVTPVPQHGGQTDSKLSEKSDSIHSIPLHPFHEKRLSRIEEQFDSLKKLPDNLALLDQVGSPTAPSLGDVWKYVQVQEKADKNTKMVNKVRIIFV